MACLPVKFIIGKAACLINSKLTELSSGYSNGANRETTLMSAAITDKAEQMKAIKKANYSQYSKSL
jgi:hypothetical protein